MFCNPQVKDQISRLIQTAVDNGASLLLDGRNILVIIYSIYLEENIIFDCFNYCSTRIILLFLVLLAMHPLELSGL